MAWPNPFAACVAAVCRKHAVHAVVKPSPAPESPKGKQGRASKAPVSLAREARGAASFCVAEHHQALPATARGGGKGGHYAHRLAPPAISRVMSHLSANDSSPCYAPGLPRCRAAAGHAARS